MSMSLKCDFSFTLKIAHPEFVTEKWLSVSILPTKPSLPKLLKDPYLAKVLSPTDQLNLPYNQSKWKYCFEEFYYCEYVSSNICDTKQFLKLYNSELEIHIEEVAPSIECSQCYKMIRPGRLIKHIFKHLLAQFPARDANKHLCLHCLSPNKKSFELLKHQVMIVSANNDIRLQTCAMPTNNFNFNLEKHCNSILLHDLQYLLCKR